MILELYRNLPPMAIPLGSANEFIFAQRLTVGPNRSHVLEELDVPFPLYQNQYWFDILCEGVVPQPFLYGKFTIN